MSGASHALIGSSGSAPVAGAHAAAFLARTSGLDGAHTNAYIYLINGLDTDGLFAKLDMLHVYATQDSVTALLNLISTSYNGTANGSPAFTADRGFTGVNNSSTVYINTGFNAATAISPQFVQNSAHISAWSVTSVTSSNKIISVVNAGATNSTSIHTRFTDGSAYYRVNSTNTAGIADATGAGHYLANRSTSSAVQGYKNGGSVLTNGSDTSQAVINLNFYTLASNNNGTVFGCADQAAMASIGSNLSSTDATNFYNRLRTFMTAVGVP